MDADDVLLNADRAGILATMAAMNGDLLMWSVTERPRDFPDKFVARPHSSLTGMPILAHLEADTLEDLRKLIPAEFMLDRDPNDDPVIVEVWM